MARPDGRWLAFEVSHPSSKRTLDGWGTREFGAGTEKAKAVVIAHIRLLGLRHAAGGLWIYRDRFLKEMQVKEMARFTAQNPTADVDVRGTAGLETRATFLLGL